jgi:protein-S-isoprenylcysteine O-methyltransferase Ste14
MMNEAAPMAPDPTAANRRSGIEILLDWGERTAILALYGWLVARMVASYLSHGALIDLLLLPSEGLVVLLILVRRDASVISRRPADWMLGFSATSAALLVYPGVGRPLVPVTLAATMLLMGLLVQVHAKLVLGRSFGCVPANRGLKFAGPYRYVRHPMYLGYLISHVAFFSANPTVWNLGVYLLCYGLQVPRLLAEERLLSQDPRYLDYMSRVRYRLIPRVF